MRFRIGVVVVLILVSHPIPSSAYEMISTRYEPPSNLFQMTKSISGSSPVTQKIHYRNVHVFDVFLLYFELPTIIFHGYQVVNLEILVNWSGYVLSFNFTNVQLGTEYSLGIDQTGNEKYWGMVNNQTFYSDPEYYHNLEILFIFTSTKEIECELNWHLYHIFTAYLEPEIGKSGYKISSSMIPRGDESDSVHRTLYIVFPIIFMDWALEDKSHDGIDVNLNYFNNQSTWDAAEIESPINFYDCEAEWMLCGYGYQPKQLFAPVSFPEILGSDSIEVEYGFDPQEINSFSNAVLFVLGLIFATVSYKLTLLDGRKRRENQEMDSNPRVFEYEMQRKYGGL